MSSTVHRFARAVVIAVFIGAICAFFAFMMFSQMPPASFPNPGPTSTTVPPHAGPSTSVHGHLTHQG
jgi:hypothetical protein